MPSGFSHLSDSAPKRKGKKKKEKKERHQEWCFY
jgi:hypothetical protein